MRCPICSSEESTIVDLLTYEDLHWKKCLSCGIGWQYPYTGELSRDDPSLSETYDKYIEMHAAFSPVAKEKADWVLAHASRYATLIEIGPGVGALALELKLRHRGAYIAVEPNEHFADHLRKNGITAFSGEPREALLAAIQEARAMGESVLMILDNVLEHIEDPRSFLQDIAAKLPTGSKLLIEVPNEYGIKWRTRIYDCLRGAKKPPTFPGHINLFERDSLSRLLTSTFSNVQVRYKGIRSEEQVSYLSQSLRTSRRAKFAIKMLRMMPVDYLLGIPYWLRAEAEIHGAMSTGSDSVRSGNQKDTEHDENYPDPSRQRHRL